MLAAKFSDDQFAFNNQSDLNSMRHSDSFFSFSLNILSL